MLDRHFLSPPVASPPAPSDSTAPHARPDVFGLLRSGERVLWQGRCAVAEYAFDEVASPPRWTLPEMTAVLVTDRRVVYAHTAADGHEVTSGELRWLWPQHLSVQPGSLAPGRAAGAPQIQLVCAAIGGTFPALVFAGGDLTTVGDADRLANHLRHAIARFRVDNVEKLGLSMPQTRMLSRLLIGPEFSNYQGGAGQTVTLLGSLPIHRPTPAPAEPDVTAAQANYAASVRDEYAAVAQADYAAAAYAGHVPAEPYPASVSGATVRLPGYRPGLAADEARALQAAAAEEETQLAQPDLASRAAELAARVADLVSEAARPATAASNPSDTPTTDLTARAENVRRAAARFAANSAKGKAQARHSARETGFGNRAR